ncbi:MAG: mechanosensitive ion channel [Alphaproteobacteria bacterium]
MLEQARPLTAALRQLADSAIELLPSLLMAILLLVLGWVVARVLRAITLRSARTLNRGAQAVGLGGFVRTASLEGSTTRILASIIYWLVILFFLTAATRVLGLYVFAGWLDQLVGYLPNILSGCLIIFAGAILAGIARDATTAALPGLSEQQRMLAGRLVQGLTLVILLVVGLDQIGIDITVIITVLAVAIAAFLGGLSLAFSLGARAFVSNVIGAHYLDRDFDVGQRIRIAGLEGTILEVTAVAVILETADGRLTVPAHLFAEQATLVLTTGAAHG